MWTGLLALVNDVGSRCAICVAACLFGVPVIPKGLVEGPTNRGGVTARCMVWVNLANGAWFEFRWLGLHGWGARWLMSAHASSVHCQG